ncbi:MAG TPA: geranylgeranyl reductase family protein [Chloroflexi bacterium]|nr:geranylgeranyl reductase family protein [Chloroflexota bacterium]
MFDLVVVGGGPAGSSAARRAGALGLRTLLLEKEQFPRYKACGGGVTGQALSSLDFALPPRLCDATIFAARVHFEGRSIEARGESPLAAMVSRSDFDALLLEKALEGGVVARMGERVRGLEEHQNAVEVLTDDGAYEATYVIVAEGAQGTLKRTVRRKDREDEYGVCLVSEIRNEDSPRDYRQDTIEVHFGIGGMGYGWVFPHGEHLSVGIGGLASSLRSPKEIMAGFLRDRGFDPHHRARGHLIPVGGVRRTLASSRILLAGDAAGFLDSFTGEGIAYAIRSGQIAAEVISGSLLSGRHPKAQGEYQTLCEKEFGSNLRYSLFLARIMHRFPGIFFRLLASHQEVIDNFAKVATAQWSYGHYLRWLIPRLPGYLLQR